MAFPSKVEKNSLSNAHFSAMAEKLSTIRQSLEGAFLGQEMVVTACLAALLANGHALLMGVPGLGKTFLVEKISEVMGLQKQRIQATPDLMPSDILGSEILDEAQDGTRHFRFIQGPIFCQLLMFDEINRASPRTQSALLQAMQEKHVTIAGKSYELPKPFHVFATQNPLEQEGTYPLPEAQLDRFLLQVNLTYPRAEDEEAVILSNPEKLKQNLPALFSGEELQTAQALIQSMPIGEKISDAVIRFLRALRPEQTEFDEVKRYLAYGPGTRAGQAFIGLGRALAALDGRMTPSLDDMKYLAPMILRHRLGLHYTARADGISADDLVMKIWTKLFGA